MDYKNRNISFDILKLISMFSIVVLHTLGHSGMLNYDLALSDGLQIWILEAISISSVNCYVLISGYFLINSKFDFKRVLKIWIEVFVFSLLAFMFAIALKITPFSFVDFFKTITPILSRQYWFITVYIILYIFSPYINLFLRGLSKEQFRNFILLLIVTFSFIPSIFNFSSFMDIYGGGTGIVWFICLYCVGGYIRIYKQDFTKKTTYFLLLCFFSLISFSIGVLPFFTKSFQIHSFFVIASQYYMNYSTLIVFFQSLFLFLWFLNLKFKLPYTVKKILIQLSTVSLGVYLLHDNGFIRDWLWKTIDLPNLISNNQLAFFEVLKSAFIVFLPCLLLSYMLCYLIDRLFDLIRLKKK